jgi:hypothetical protein
MPLARQLRDGLAPGVSGLLDALKHPLPGGHVMPLDVLADLHEKILYGGPFDALRGAVLVLVDALNRAMPVLDFLADEFVFHGRPKHPDRLATAVYLAAGWLVTHHPEKILLARDLIAVLVYGNWGAALTFQRGTASHRSVASRRETFVWQALQRAVGRQMAKGRQTLPSRQATVGWLLRHPL